MFNPEKIVNKILGKEKKLRQDLKGLSRKEFKKKYNIPDGKWSLKKIKKTKLIVDDQEIIVPEEEWTFKKKVKQKENILEFLYKLAESNTSSEEDDKKLQNILRNSGFHNAVIVSSIVYIDGHGESVSANMIAKMLLKLIENIRKI